MTWTPERITKLLSLAGTMPAAKVGKIIGKSKNAVTGKLTRMGLARAEPVKVDPQSGHKPLIDLQPQDCRYPLDRLFCAAERQNAVKPYCRVHNELCYRRERRR